MRTLARLSIARPEITRPSFRVLLATSLAVIAGSSGSVSAQTIEKADNADNLNLTTSWVGGVVPGPANLARWDSVVTTANTTVLGANLSWLGVQITNPGGLVTIGAGNTLTLGTGGIDMSAATQDFTVNAAVALGTGRQTWNVAAGRTLTVAAVPTKSIGVASTLQLSTTGTTVLGATTTNLITDTQNNPYATYGLNDWAGLNAGTVVASTETAATTALTAGAINDIQASFASVATTDISALRFNAAAAYTLSLANSATARTLTARGILITANSGGGAISGTAASSFVRPSRVAISNTTLNVIQNSASDFTIGAIISNGSSNAPAQLVVSGTGVGKVVLTDINGYTGGTNIGPASTIQVGAAGTIGSLGTGGVVNNGALLYNRSDALTETNAISGTGTLSQIGTGSVTLTGASSLTGSINVNAGTLIANLSNNSTNPVTGALGNPQVARNINVNNGGTLQFANGDTLGGAQTTVANTLVINAGGIVTNNGTSFNTLGAVNLNGGTLTGTGGSGNTLYQMYFLAGPVTVGGTAPSTISGSGTTSGYHLAAPTTFNVASTGATGVSDLLVSGTLIDQTGGQNSAPGSLTKTGGGILELTAANTYAGTTTLNAGTLLLSTGSINGSATINVTAGTLTLQNAAALSDTGTLTLATGTALRLDAGTGTSETVAGLVVNGTTQATGTFTAAQLNTMTSSNIFESLNGETLTIVAVPEPGTLAVGLICLGGMALQQRRRLKGAFTTLRA